MKRIFTYQILVLLLICTALWVAPLRSEPASLLTVRRVHPWRISGMPLWLPPWRHWQPCMIMNGRKAPTCTTRAIGLLNVSLPSNCTSLLNMLPLFVKFLPVTKAERSRWLQSYPEWTKAYACPLVVRSGSDRGQVDRPTLCDNGIIQ